MKNSTLLMVGIVSAVVAILSIGLACLISTIMQQASAQNTNFDFRQDQKNRCSGNAFYENGATIIFAP
jgi:uncharacterized membrane protein YjgN (DUF898 family)